MAKHKLVAGIPLLLWSASLLAGLTACGDDSPEPGPTAQPMSLATDAAPPPELSPTSPVLAADIAATSSAITPPNDPANGTTSGNGVDRVLVGAAASLTDVMQRMAGEFALAHPDVTVSFNFAATGILKQQLAQGGSMDMLAGAARADVTELALVGRLTTDTVRVMAHNRLVLVSSVLDPAQITSDSAVIMTSGVVNRIGIGHPDYVPAGQYAVRVLEAMNLKLQIDAKLVMAENVRQALAWAESGDVDVAWVYATDAAISARVSVVAEADPDLTRIEYAIGLPPGNETGPARLFYDFVLGEQGQAILAEYGFLPAAVPAE